MTNKRLAEMEGLGAFVVILLLLCSPVGCISRGKANDYLPRTSLVRVLANPERFEGKRVVVAGFYHYELESSALYLSRDDAKFGILGNSIWIGEAECDSSATDFGRFNDTFVEISGVVHYESDGVGHLGLFSVALEGVKVVGVLPMGTHWQENTNSISR